MAINFQQLIASSNHPQAQDILDVLVLLGMPATLKKISSDLDIYDLLKRGLPRRILQSLVNKTGFTIREVSIGIAVTEQKLKYLMSRRNPNPLSPSESLAIWQFASVFALAKKVFGENESAREWLFSKPRGTVFRRPIELLALSPGVSFVLRYLNQIDHGVYI